jgi:hypothetical protein
MSVHRNVRISVVANSTIQQIDTANEFTWWLTTRATIFWHVAVYDSSYDPRMLQKNGNFESLIVAFSCKMQKFFYFIPRPSKDRLIFRGAW